MVKPLQYRMGKLFLALSHPMRLRLLHLLGEREVCVCDLVEALRQPQPKISRHLAALRNAGIVAARREGKWMHYRVVPALDQRARLIVSETLQWLDEDKAKPTSIKGKNLQCCPPASTACGRKK